MLAKLLDIKSCQTSLINSRIGYKREIIRRFKVVPLLSKAQTISEYPDTELRAKILTLHKKYLLYCYHETDPKIIKGYISTLYDTWFIFTEVSMNVLEYNDCLYGYDHDEQLDKNCEGIMYEIVNYNS
jgi:hypothetical protein